jgi:glutamate dehydrogenase
LSLPYEEGFPPDYRTMVPPRLAVRDVLRLESAIRSGRDALDLRPPVAGDFDAFHRLVVYGVKPHDLDAIIPLLRNLGLRIVDQIQFAIRIGDQQLFIRKFSVKATNHSAAQLSLYKRPLLQALDALLSGQMDDDAMNGLILLTGFDWRIIDLFRAYCNYYLQINNRFERHRIHRALIANFETVRLLYRYFETRFNPDERLGVEDGREAEGLTQLRLNLIAGLEKVADMSEDRILRDIFNLIDATLRTNFFYRRGCPEFFVSLKINSLGVINMPSPKPLVEIYVHSRSMEGIHLRGAKIARGGIRWSERPDDLRSEILALMRTQMMKNALIVPQGAKGGFVLKTPCVDADERARLAREGYAIFMRGLLDLTDSANGADIVRPPQLVRYDDADPYLVVAPDKGTAGFSDRANEIAAEYGYWLADSFATGGSRGFHHKRLGVTARGAFVCVRQHFRELGCDVDVEPFTVVGVGGMEGDVFGNGMLISINIRLLAAFDAEHIFLDPNPNRQAAFAERKRLFETPGATWRDYDPALISSGGGVFRRAAKDIPLSPEMRAWLGSRNRSADGEDLIRLLLTAPADLLWMAGVGTYVKGSSETDELIADRANDDARVDAAQVRAKVVGEGANLAFTQRARIEYALRGGRINTDAVDNSGGVDLSDHEVNLKILLSPSANAGRIEIRDDERDRLFLEVSDEVCRMVLDNNYRQSLSLSLDRKRCLDNIDPFLELADQLEGAALLDRDIESFPSRKEATSRAGLGLARPELAVLMAYAKLALKRALLDAPRFPDGEWIGDFLAEYFPTKIRAQYADRLRDHLLGREIAVTAICNKVIDQAGASFLVGIDEFDPTRASEAVALYLSFDRILQGDRWRDAVRALDGKMTTDRRDDLLLQLEDALAFLCRWAWEHGRQLTPTPGVIGKWRADLEQYLDYLGESPEFTLLASTAPEASRLLFLNRLRDFPILVDLVRFSQDKLGVVAKLFEDLLGLLGLRQIAALASDVKARDPWERRLQAALDDQFRSGAARLVRMVLQTKFRDPTAFFCAFSLEARLARFQRLRAELTEASSVTLTPFAALASAFDSLIDACGAASGFH